MLVALMKAMKPKILESFKDYNAQKEFLAKISKNKNIIVVVQHNNGHMNPQQINKINKLNKLLIENKPIIIYSKKGSF